MILGLGTDIVEIRRLAQSIERSGDAFLTKVYTPEELAQAPERSPRRTEYLAGRWAAKEALAKALGTGITAQCRLNEICTLNDTLGRPTITLTGSAKDSANAIGVKHIHISIAHEKDYAVATVILEG
jgi:holo-[acyl-carrier protein] synthase